MIRDSLMDENTEVDISEYYEVPLARLKLPEKYEKLIKRIIGLNGSTNSVDETFNVETVADIIKLTPNYFSSCQGVGKLYVDTLIEFKKALPFFLKKQQGSNTTFIEDIFTSSDNSYDFSTPINKLALSSKYKKLIKRISVVIDNIETVQDIIDIDVTRFSNLPAIGKLYIESLIKLQSAISLTKIIQTNCDFDKIVELSPPITLTKDQLETPLNQLALSTQYKRLIKRISTAVGNVNTVQDIIQIDPFYFSNLPAVGKQYVNQLVEFKELLPSFLEKQTQKSMLFNDNYSIEFNDIDNILIEDVEVYLWTLDEIKMDVALSRWGFNHEHESLEIIGNRYKVTRERIRQLEQPINTNLPLHLTIQPRMLWANIREKMTENLTALLPNLAKCFTTEKLFYSFIELCCQVQKGSILKIIFPNVNYKIIYPLFCNTPSPITQEVVINELMSNYGYSRASAINGVKELAKLEKIKITEQGIYPKNLGKIEAVAHALSSYPDGLPWKDIVRIVNKKGYSSTLFNETRTASGFHDSEYVYLCDLGTFRSLIFLNLEPFDIPKTVQNLIDYFEKNKLNALHLHDYYQRALDRGEIEYYTLRYLIREYGEEYGLYFNGKSGSDSVSLDPDLKRITQVDVIINALNESKVAMTMQEIAERLRSKSTGHASFYINNLIEEGKVVRVDKMVYTTPEKAFVNMDIKAIMQTIQDVMNIKNIIVESDVFREYVNMELNLSYSKYIYMAFVRSYLKDLAWYRNNTLYSKYPIPYKNMFDMCKQLCDPELPKNQNVKTIQNAVWLTDAVAADAIQQWKWQICH